jgi:hypothetical protein
MWINISEKLRNLPKQILIQIQETLENSKPVGQFTPVKPDVGRKERRDP